MVIVSRAVPFRPDNTKKAHSETCTRDGVQRRLGDLVPVSGRAGPSVHTSFALQCRNCLAPRVPNFMGLRLGAGPLPSALHV